MITYYLRNPNGDVFPTTQPEIWGDCESLGSGDKGKQAYKESCIAQLKAVLTKGTTIYCVLRSVSRSGMSRQMSFFIIDGGEIWHLDNWVAGALNLKRRDSGYPIVEGCGTDMGFHCVYRLGEMLFPDEEKAGYLLNYRWI